MPGYCGKCGREAPCVSVEGLHCSGWRVGGPFNSMAWKCPVCLGDELFSLMEKAMSVRANVFDLLNEERNHQDEKWGTLQEHPHEVGGWLTLMRTYLARAEEAWSTSRGDAAALAEIRKVTALGVACLEQHG